MASIGHVAVGFLAASVARCAKLERPWRSPIVMSGLSLLPDADVVGFALGIAYEDPFGHRGATHSLLFAVVVAVAAALLARASRDPRWRRVGVLVLLVVASHGLLDMLTDGGLGVALFFPSNERLFFPWRPIPVAPIGRAFFSRWGLDVAVRETAWFSPVILTAAWLWWRCRATFAAE